VTGARRPSPPRVAIGVGLALAGCARGPGPAAETPPEVVRSYEQVATADETVYADEPYWYKPGHPERPAEAQAIRSLPGFEVERILAVPGEQGSWTAIAVDPKGRLITAAQHRGGLYRITPADSRVPGSLTRVEQLGGVAARMGWSQGLLHAGGALYVTVAEANDTTPTGLYRLRDTDGDDEYDAVDRLFGFDPIGEHGPHNLVASPDGEWLYMVGGNGLPPPPPIARRLTAATTGLDHLMPPAFGSSEYTPGGWVIRFRPAGGERELVASGLRNSYDLAFDRHGELFAFDSDMEWDLGAPWYRPTRICHLVSGAELGWRGDAAKWPEYFEDSVPPVVNVGPGSPTGIAFGYSARFPERYREALFVADWTLGAIDAVHLRPEGAGYAAEFEEFLGGTGLPVTDLVFGGDGALYFVVGGRRLGSALYRVRYTGAGAAAAEPLDGIAPPQGLHALRQRLESFHGSSDPGALDEVWPYLGHPDRLIRFAARVAVEARPVASWRERALAASGEPALPALLALARQGPPSSMAAVLGRLEELSWEGLSRERRLLALRVYELALARAESVPDALRSRVRVSLRGRFPDADTMVTRELSRLLCFLGDGSLIDPLLERMAGDSGSRPFLGVAGFARNPKYGQAIRDMLESAPLLERMHHAQMLLWVDGGWSPEQRRRYFSLIADARLHSKGGHTYQDLWDRIQEAALRQVPAGERAALEAIAAASRPVAPGLPAPIGPGREWTLDAALALVERGLGDRDAEAGRRAYAAAGCGLCHRMGLEGGTSGPDLTAVGRRFGVRDILESILDPSRTISDQYRVSLVETKDGRTVSGRIVSRDDRSLRIAENLMRPGQSVELPAGEIARVQPVPVSTMPSGLLDALSPDEVLDLVAYLSGAGRSDAEAPQQR